MQVLLQLVLFACICIYIYVYMADETLIILNKLEGLLKTC